MTALAVARLVPSKLGNEREHIKGEQWQLEACSQCRQPMLVLRRVSAGGHRDFAAHPHNCGGRP